MFKWLFKKTNSEQKAPISTENFNISDNYDPYSDFLLNKRKIDYQLKDDIYSKAIQAKVDEFIIHSPEKFAMDSGSSIAMDSHNPTAVGIEINSSVMPLLDLNWYAAQSFIGYQTCAIISQHWLVNKACEMPARDSVRNGFTISVNDGSEADAEVLDEIRDLDTKFQLNKNLIQFVKLGKVFGIRIAMFIIDSDDPDYYLKPFNPDGIKPGSYRGISQIDPYWTTPQLDVNAASNPEAKDFYEPTFWRIGSKLIHKSHLVIYKGSEVPDILKPTYRWGGLSIAQKIYERVYAAERTANEAPMLALTKRSTIYKMDLSKAAMNECGLSERLNRWVHFRDNYGVKVADLEEDITQIDTSLADLDALIMTQYQLVSAIANVPSVKLLGTSPKGFNSSGSFEMENYREELESIQENDLTPLIERHHLCLIRSIVAPKYGISPFSTCISWNALNVMTEKEKAEVNRIRAETGSILQQSGVIDNEDERNRIIADSDSGYNGLELKDLNDLDNEMSELLENEERSKEENSIS